MRGLPRVSRQRGNRSGDPEPEAVGATELEAALADWLQDASRVLVCAAGNTFRQDDGAGPAMLARLERLLAAGAGGGAWDAGPPDADEESAAVPVRTYLNGSVHCCDCGNTPEDALGTAAEVQAGHVLFLDAVHMRAPAGSTALLDPDQSEEYTISTHRLPMVVLSSLLRRQGTRRVAVLGVQAARTGVGQELTPEVNVAVDRAAAALHRALTQRRTP